VGAAPALDLTVTLDPDQRRLEVIAKLPVSGRSFEFELHESLTVSEAVVADCRIRPADAATPRDGTRLWRLALPAGAKQLRITYAGTLPATEVHRDYRQVLSGLPPMAAAEGSFLPAGSGWYPQPQAALFAYRVRLSVPGEQRALVAGRLFEERLPVRAGERYQAEFEFSAGNRRHRPDGRAMAYSRAPGGSRTRTGAAFAHLFSGRSRLRAGAGCGLPHR
jgi:aminopeptidase N